MVAWWVVEVHYYYHFISISIILKLALQRELHSGAQVIATPFQLGEHDSWQKAVS